MADLNRMCLEAEPFPVKVGNKMCSALCTASMALRKKVSGTDEALATLEYIARTLGDTIRDHPEALEVITIVAIITAIKSCCVHIYHEVVSQRQPSA